MSNYLLSFFTTSAATNSPPSLLLIGAGIVVILGAAAAAILSSRAKNSTSSALALQRQKVYDPYRTTAFMANGTLGKEDVYDTVINCAIRFDKPVPKETIMELFKKHLVPFQQFHCIPKTVPAKSSNVVWEPLPGEGKLDIAQLFIDHTSASAAQTTQIVEKIANDSASIRKEGATLPWWRVHLINETCAGGGQMMVISIHHCIGDGVSLMSAFSKIISKDATGTPLDLSAIFSPASRGDPLGGDRGILANIFKPWRWPLALLETADFILCFIITALHPTKAQDTPTCFTQQTWPPTTNEHVMIPMGRHSLDAIKKIKNAAGKRVTVNDVEYALYAGMMRRYLLKHGGMTPAQIEKGQFRGLVPFAIPHPIPAGKELTHTMANTFTFLVNELPLKSRTAKDRVLYSHKIWQPVKTRSFVPAAFSATLLAASVLPLSMQQQTCVDLMSRQTVVFSNLPGPADSDMWIAGSKVTELNIVYANVVPQVVILSMNGEMHYSLTMKRFGQEGKESDCKIALPKLFKEELDELCEQFNISC